MTDNLQHQIALTLVPLIGPVTAKILVSYCGSAEAVFRASRRELMRIPGIGPQVADSLRQTDACLRQAEHEITFMEHNGVEALFYTDPRYPARLRQNQDCPSILFFKGSDAALLGARRILAVVGTRQPTDYGRQMCEEILGDLLSYDVVMVSGLAFGIDVTAHRKASALGMPNIGVLGHGLGNIYPSEHRSTAMKMIENGGLLSEYTHRTKPDREHFPMRNRIIAGLCDALLVVETASTGGSMITAELACQYEREVFAVPGRVREPKSAGCNMLIKDNRAQLVESAEDLAIAMRWDQNGQQKPVQTQLFPDLSPAEEILCKLIRQHPEIPVDLLTLQSGLNPGLLASSLLELEFKGLVRTLPGKRYVCL